MSVKKDVLEGSEFYYDICIIGSGPAGMVLVSELVDSRKSICVLESGIERPTAYGNALRKVESLGEIKIKPSSRERVLGGASTTWGGGSAPMDEIDFYRRSYLSHSFGWPFGLSEMVPFYKRASIYGFPKFEMFNDVGLEEIRKAGDVMVSLNRIEEKIFIAVDPPWNFGEKLRYVFDKPKIDLYMDATVLDLTSKINSDREKYVAWANVVSSKNAKWKIKAKIFVIAAGGLESVRLLLLSDNLSPNGLGNNHDQVGRYLMNHPKGSFGTLRLNRPIKKLPYFFGYFNRGFAGYSGLRLSRDTQNSLGLGNSYIRFEPVFPWTDNSGVFAFLTIVKKVKIFINLWKKNQKKIVHLRDYNETPDDDKNDKTSSGSIWWLIAFFRILININSVANYVFHRLFPSRDLSIKTIRLRNFMEMEPRWENRMTLSSNIDSNGKRRILVNINTSPLDRKSLVVLHKIFNEEIKKIDLGILESNLENENPWPINFDASHHLGGTRMGDDPKTSVVNKDLRVHDVSNLYISSGSVFPTSGCANPTYTICALSVRLADTLKK